MTQKTKTLPVGSNPQTAGFTLLELLVVLSIIAAISAVVVAYVPRGSTETHVKAAAKQLVSGFRLARSVAIKENRSTVVTLDLAKRSYQVDGQPRKELPGDLALLLYTSASEVVDAKVGSVRFFPDGSSTGGQVRLRHPGVKKDAKIISIDWTTGRVAVSD